MGSKPLWLNGLGNIAEVDKSSKLRYNTYIDSNKQELEMDLTTIYLTGFVVTVGAFAVRAPDVESRTLFLIAISWPLSMAFALFIYLLSLAGADLDVQDSDKMFGYRKPTNPEVKGFAITVFHSEVRFWKQKKA